MPTVKSSGVKRGRKPKDGVAKTSTQRVQAIRERDDLQIKRASTAEDYQKFSTRLLLKAMEDAVKNGYQNLPNGLPQNLLNALIPKLYLLTSQTKR